jgi:ribosomal protein S27E
MEEELKMREIDLDLQNAINAEFNKTAIKTGVFLDSKVYIECPNCGDIAEVDTGMILTSYPPQYNWHCEHCGMSGSIECSKVNAIDPAVFVKHRARFATYCEICGDEILIYGDEKPKICKNCKEAVIAVRKALGTWEK